MLDRLKSFFKINKKTKISFNNQDNNFNLNSEEGKIFVSIVQEFIWSNIFLQKFKHIEIRIEPTEDKSKSTLMSVDLGKVSIEFVSISIFLDKFLKSIENTNKPTKFKKLEILIFEYLNHELIHIIHVIFSNKHINQTYVRRLINTGRIEEYEHPSTNYYRNYLEDLYHLVLIEGVATFFQKERDFSIEEFEKEYNKNIYLLLFIFDSFHKLREPLETDEIEKRKPWYKIGFMMTYSIMIGIENLKFEEIFKISNKEFLELHELAIENINAKYNKDFKIFFSFNSKKGILDYSEIVNFLKRTERKLRDDN